MYKTKRLFNAHTFQMKRATDLSGEPHFYFYFSQWNLNDKFKIYGNLSGIKIQVFGLLVERNLGIYPKHLLYEFVIHTLLLTIFIISTTLSP